VDLGLRLRCFARKASSRTRRAALGPLVRVRPDPTLVRLGSAGCGWWVPADVVVPGAVAYCAGAGEDITFDLELHRRGLDVVTLDPTPRAAAHVASVDPGDDRFTFVPVGLWTERATLTFHAPADPRDVSYSVLDLQHTGGARALEAEVDSLGSPMADQGHDHVDLLKVDIEGAESTVLPDLLRTGPRPPVVCFEYDQPQPARGLLRLLAAFREAGYALVSRERWNFTVRQPAG
jgi:FkbM family methyltransferase